jgi:hypothetical protein
MEKYFETNLKPLRFGILFSLLTLMYGFGLGGAFGAAEDNIMDHLKGKANQVLDTVYKGDADKIEKVLDKSWIYFKRAHLHANGLGAASLALILLLSFLPFNNFIKGANALFLGMGSFGYALFWMLAGLKAPELGSTGLAKESLQFIAIPSAGLCIVGLVMVIGLTIKALFCRCHSNCK